MKELILVAGENKVCVCQFRRCLREEGFSSIPCKSAEQLVEEMRLLPSCNTRVILVVTEAAIFKDIEDDLFYQLCTMSPEVPFVLFDEPCMSFDQLVRYDKICDLREKFRIEQYPELAKVVHISGAKLVGN